MGWMTGFEPATSGSTIRRSNQLSYTHRGPASLEDVARGVKRAGFEGIIYPRPLKPRRRNLALFMDRVVARKNQVFSRDDAA